MSQLHLRKYGVQTTINFNLATYATPTDLFVSAAHASGDTKVMKDEGAEANTTNGFTDEGQGYAIVLTATEMQAERVVLYIVDQTGPKAWMDEVVIVETYGNASAQHAFDLDDANPTIDGTLSGAIVAASFGAGAIDAAAIASNAITAAKIATDAITSAKIATDAIGAAQIAANAIGASELAADAVTEIQSGLATQASVNTIDDFLDTEIAAILAAVDTEVAAIVSAIAALNNISTAQVNAEVDTALADIDLDHLIKVASGIPLPTIGTFLDKIMNKNGSQTFDPTTDSLEAIRDRGDSAWGSAGASPQVLVDTTVASVVDQTHLRLTAAVGVNNTYNNMTAVIYDVSASNAPSIRKITSFLDANNEIVLDSGADFTVVATDLVKIFVTPPGTTAPTAAQVADAVWDEVTVDHQTAATFGQAAKDAGAAVRNKIAVNRTTGDQTLYEDDGSTVRKARRLTEFDDVTQGLLPI